MTSFVGTRVKAKAPRRQGRSCAAASKHWGQTQSASDPGSGIGRRKGAAVHQHSPPSPQSKARPQRAQTILRGVMAPPASIGRLCREREPRHGPLPRALA